MKTRNIHADIPPGVSGEFVESLAENKNVRIERIVSRGHVSPEDFWYDQETNEWVVVVKGRARILFEGEGDAVSLASGDYVNIPAHCRHRVVWTDPAQETIWLAVHY